MSELITTMVPIFGLIGLGFIAVKLDWLVESGVRGLVLYVFNFAIPALLFRSLASLELPDDINWWFVVAYYLGTAITYRFAMGVSKKWFGRSRPDQAIFGMTSSYSNLVMMGIPILLTAIGPEALLPILLMISFHGAVFMTLTVVLISSGKGGKAPFRAVGHAFLDVIKNPIILGIACGILARVTGFNLWTPADDLLALLEVSAVPCTLFAMGASMAGYSLAGGEMPMVFTTVTKLFIHPAVVWFITVPIFGLEGPWVAICVLLAAMPSAVNTYLFGARYDAAPDVAARTVLLTTTLSMVTVTVLLALLGF